MAGETKIPFGKFGPYYGDPRTVEETPSDYLQWILEQDWVEERYGSDLLDEIELIMAARERGEGHWHEYEEDYDR